MRSHALSDTRKETRDQTSGDLVARRNDCFRRLTRQKGCFAARLRVLSRSFRWPPEMESLETIFLKRLIRRLLYYSINYSTRDQFCSSMLFIFPGLSRENLCQTATGQFFLHPSNADILCGESWR